MDLRENTLLALLLDKLQGEEDDRAILLAILFTLPGEGATTIILPVLLMGEEATACDDGTFVGMGRTLLLLMLS